MRGVRRTQSSSATARSRNAGIVTVPHVVELGVGRLRMHDFNAVPLDEVVRANAIAARDYVQEVNSRGRPSIMGIDVPPTDAAGVMADGITQFLGNVATLHDRQASGLSQLLAGVQVMLIGPVVRAAGTAGRAVVASAVRGATSVSNRITLFRRVRAAMRSADPAVRAEGEVAWRVFRTLERFQEVVSPGGRRLGEIDVETVDRIIEVTIGQGKGKLTQIGKLLGPAMNPSGKQVVLYAPNIGNHLADQVVAAGARVVRSLAEL